MTGTKAPAFTLGDGKGNAVSLDSLRRRSNYVLLDIWASWCAPCRATNRKLAPLYGRLKQKGITFVSVSVDEKTDAWQQAVAADKIPWTQLLAPNGMKGNFVQQYKVRSLPATFLINKEGMIIQQGITEEDLEKL